MRIPEMTDPLSRHWRQPDTQAFLIDEFVAIMTQADFDSLAEYSTTTPTAVYAGKAWKANRLGDWYLRWYDEDDGDPRGVPTHTRRILIA